MKLLEDPMGRMQGSQQFYTDERSDQLSKLVIWLLNDSLCGVSVSSLLIWFRVGSKADLLSVCHEESTVLTVKQNEFYFTSTNHLTNLYSCFLPFSDIINDFLMAVKTSNTADVIEFGFKYFSNLRSVLLISPPSLAFLYETMQILTSPSRHAEITSISYWYIFDNLPMQLSFFVLN